MKYFFIVYWLCMAIVAGAQNRAIRFEPLELKKAVVKAKVENKMVFLNAYTTWSAGCRSMSEKVLTQNEVVDFCNASFINVEVDTEKEEGRQLAEKYGITAYPTFLVIDKDKNEVCRVVGVMDAVSFLEKLKAGINPAGSLAALEKQYQGGDRSYTCVAEYLEFLHRTHSSEQLRVVVEDYFKDMEVKEICHVNNWKLFDSYVNAVDMPQMKRMVARAATFKSLLGKEEVERKMYGVYEQAFTDSLVGAKEITLAQYKSFADDVKKMKLRKEQKAGLETLLQLAYFKSHRMYADYLKTYQERGRYLTETQKQNVVFTLSFFAEASADLKEQAIGLVDQLVQSDRVKGLSPQMEQVYNYVIYTLKGKPEEE